MRRLFRFDSFLPREKVFLTLLFFSFSLPGANSAQPDKTEKGSLQLSSPAFSEGAAIPAKYTCDEKNLSPPLKWSGVPAEAKSLVLIVEDPDAPAGIWVHWILYDLPASTSELAENEPKNPHLPNGATQGLNDFKHLGYSGPCPPAGKPHRYFFKLYALDKKLDFKPSVTKKDVEHAMETHIVATAQLMGTYQRK